MHNYIGKKVLITTQGWFYGADGKQYRSIHGTLKAVHEAGKTLGFIPNRSHANWFIEIGDMVIMGCQVMYVLACDSFNQQEVDDFHTGDNYPDGIKYYKRPCTTYVTT